MDQKKIGEFIFKNRKKQNLTQNELAKKLNVSNHTISNWENGKSMPSYELLIPLTKELNVSISELINGEFESKKEEPNKVIEKTINFLRQIDKDKKKKYRNIGILLIIIGLLIKILSMILIEPYWEYNTYYAILSYIISLIGISYIYQKEKVKTLIFKTTIGGIIFILLFISIDICEIKINNTVPRYTTGGGRYYTLEYHQTLFYDVYRCYKHDFSYETKNNYTIIFKKNKIRDNNFSLDMKQLEEKYCKND